MNGQGFRRKIVEEIMAAVEPEFIIETGTFRGVTTEYLCQLADIRVFTIEINKRSFGFASARLRKFNRVKLLEGDSVSVLPEVIQSNNLENKIGFYYLDSHWETYLPILDELKIICSRESGAVVLIDDFKIPKDEGYTYDDYGEAGALTLEYLSDIISRYGLTGYFPNCPSSQETGKRRGALILTNDAFAAALDKIDSLVKAV